MVGDIHGQYDDFLAIFETNGWPSENNPYLFNGDFVDRGPKSYEVMCLLLALKVAWPDHVHLNRGNHETSYATTRYGFYKEIVRKFKKDALWERFTELFQVLPLAHVINKKVFVVHGGLWDARENSLSELRSKTVWDRKREPMRTETDENGEEFYIRDPIWMWNVLWSDPVDGQTYQSDGRGLKFGQEVTKAFFEQNDISLMIRSHECKYAGYSKHHDGKVMTVFSAPRYYDKGYENEPVYNLASYAVFRAGEDRNLHPSYDIFSEKELSFSDGVDRLIQKMQVAFEPKHKEHNFPNTFVHVSKEETAAHLLFGVESLARHDHFTNSPGKQLVPQKYADEFKKLYERYKGTDVMQTIADVNLDAIAGKKQFLSDQSKTILEHIKLFIQPEVKSNPSPHPVSPPPSPALRPPPPAPAPPAEDNDHRIHEGAEEAKNEEDRVIRETKEADAEKRKQEELDRQEAEEQRKREERQAEERAQQEAELEKQRVQSEQRAQQEAEREKQKEAEERERQEAQRKRDEEVQAQLLAEQREQEKARQQAETENIQGAEPTEQGETEDNQADEEAVRTARQLEEERKPAALTSQRYPRGYTKRKELEAEREKQQLQERAAVTIQAAVRRKNAITTRKQRKVDRDKQRRAGKARLQAEADKPAKILQPEQQKQKEKEKVEKPRATIATPSVSRPLFDPPVSPPKEQRIVGVASRRDHTDTIIPHTNVSLTIEDVENNSCVKDQQVMLMNLFEKFELNNKKKSTTNPTIAAVIEKKIAVQKSQAKQLSLPLSKKSKTKKVIEQDCTIHTVDGSTAYGITPSGKDCTITKQTLAVLIEQNSGFSHESP